MRILATRLTQEQRDTLRSQIRFPTLTYHAWGQSEDRGILLREVFDCLWYGDVVEWHNERRSRVVLMRKGNVCAAVDLDHQKILTVYRCDDTHNTLDPHPYWEGPIPNVLA